MLSGCYYMFVKIDWALMDARVSYFFNVIGGGDDVIWW